MTDFDFCMLAEKEDNVVDDGGMAEGCRTREEMLDYYKARTGEDDGYMAFGRIRKHA